TGFPGKLLEALLPEGRTRRSLVLCHVLRCHPPADFYPSQEQGRAEMERRCREYDRALRKFNPTVVGVTWHPSLLIPAKQQMPQGQIFACRALAAAFELSDLGERPL